MPPPAQALYCDADGVAARIGQLAVNLRADDDPIVLDYAINRGSADIEIKLRSKFPAADFTQVAWIYWAAVSFASRHLCRHRLNSVPEELDTECKEAEADLDKLAAGTLTLLNLPRFPGGVAVSNQHVQLGRFPQLAVERPRSTNPNNPTFRRFDLPADQIPPPWDGTR